jgi:hypothetical protein
MQVSSKMRKMYYECPALRSLADVLNVIAGYNLSGLLYNVNRILITNLSEDLEPSRERGWRS